MKLHELTKNHPIVPILLYPLLIYQSKQYSINSRINTCPRTCVLSVECSLKITSLALLFKP